MATGIVALAARGAHRQLLSEALLGLAIALYVILLVYHMTRFARRREVLRSELGTSAVFDYLTLVAAGAVIGSGLLRAGSSMFAAWALLLFSGLVWIVLTMTLLLELLALHSLHPRSELEGGWLLAVVAPQSLSILIGALAAGHGLGTAFWLAFGLWLFASMLYVPIAQLRLQRLGLAAGMLRVACSRLRSDDWILMGALAISALAGAQLIDLSNQASAHGVVHSALTVVVDAQLTVAVLFLPLLIVSELGRVRFGVTFDELTAERWSTVFPLGMLSVSCRALASTMSLAALRPLADALFAVALAAWLANAVLAVSRWARHVPR